VVTVIKNRICEKGRACRWLYFGYDGINERPWQECDHKRELVRGHFHHYSGAPKECPYYEEREFIEPIDSDGGQK
jgi:hypothetical protein